MPDTGWQPLPPCETNRRRPYGVGRYGVGPYSRYEPGEWQAPRPCKPGTWEPAEMCGCVSDATTTMTATRRP